MAAQEIKLTVDTDRCKNCGICALDCVNRTSLEGTKHVDPGSPLCDKCCHCFAICPNNAITMDREFDADCARADDLDRESFLAILKKRRSTRRFMEKEIPADILDMLLESVRYIPSGGNNHEMTITVIRDREKMKELRKRIIAYYDRTMTLIKNPLIRNLLKLAGDEKVKETVNDAAFLKKIDPLIARMKTEEDVVFYDAPLIVLFHTKRILPTAKEDCILAAYNVVLTAELYGLGSCFVSLSQQALTADRNCKSAVGLGKDERVHAVLVIGYPKHEYRRAAYRGKKNIVLM